MIEENKYIRSDRFERVIGNVYEKINDNDRKHTDAIYELNSKVDKQTLLQQQTFDSQKKSEKHLEKLNETMTNIGSEMTDIKYKVKTHDDKLQSVQGVINEKQKGNTQIAIAAIGLLVPIIYGAFELAKLMFN